MKRKKKITVDTYGKKGRSSFSGHRTEVIPQDCKYRSTYDAAAIIFMGRFKFGVKEQLVRIANAFGVNTTSSLSNKTGMVVVDDLKRTNSVTIDKARKRGTLIVSEEEFLQLIATNKKNTEIKYEKI